MVSPESLTRGHWRQPLGQGLQRGAAARLHFGDAARELLEEAGSPTWATSTVFRRPDGAQRNWSQSSAPTRSACQERSER
jgi:hypothetical protein